MPWCKIWRSSFQPPVTFSSSPFPSHDTKTLENQFRRELSFNSLSSSSFTLNLAKLLKTNKNQYAQCLCQIESEEWDRQEQRDETYPRRTLVETLSQPIFLVRASPERPQLSESTPSSFWYAVSLFLDSLFHTVLLCLSLTSSLFLDFISLDLLFLCCIFLCLVLLFFFYVPIG